METILIIVAVLVVGYFFLQKFESLKGKTEEELRNMLSPNSRDLFYRNAALELKKRGVDIKQYTTLFIGQMESKDKNTRIRGWDAIKKVYPELAQSLDLKLVAEYEEYLACAKELRKRIATE